jgi:hypothetical protein
MQIPMSAIRIDDLPGYRRRLRVTPSDGSVRSELEDGYHCMAVTIQHDGRVARSVAVLDWIGVTGRIIAPAASAGLDLDDMRHSAGWASMRTGNMASRSRCYTFQPHRVGNSSLALHQSRFAGRRTP